MKGCLIALAVFAAGLVNTASAEAFRCIGRDGKVGFAATPCPDYIGQAMLQRPGQPRLSSDWEERDYPHRPNKNATDILQISRRQKIIITNEKDICDHLQSLRPAPPGVSSRCVAPHYDSACFALWRQGPPAGKGQPVPVGF
ncbi:DUF4124 domain-containing protein [Pseudomonas sp. LP_7_YM]|uniref:DUF4124 domain-containing protein n=1 Tax=Pseudomonas sp. LP_7_YM TaxID=2485137 RepID=UPI0010E04B22|nr:DUF4124 domain-containing protein [Pseudomonas sp. LP_7_YM]TDV71966.1 hypothetical protein EC915_10199 [Pseudomonas sp. LP_7_YM]